MKKTIKTVLSVILCVAMLAANAYMPTVAVAEDEKVTVSVKFVYKDDNTMVAQPYYASIPKGSEFKKSISAPKMINYSVPVDEASGLNGTTIAYSEDADGNGTVKLDLASVNEDTEVKLVYVAGSANYTVNHYLQNLDNDNYVFDKTVGLSGSIDAYTQAVKSSYEGFECKKVPEYIIAQDGSTTVNIYYDRIYYTVIFDVNGGVNGPDPMYVKYGTAIDVSQVKVPERSGYDFNGWTPEIVQIVKADATYKAQWTVKSGRADYTIVIWGQNPNDDEYTYISSHEAWGHVGESITYDPNMLICHESTLSHTHTLACYGVSKTKDPANRHKTSFNKLGLESGYVYFYRYDGVGSNNDYYYYLYLNGVWYEANGGCILNKDKPLASGSYSHGAFDALTDKFYKYEAKLFCDYSHKHSAACYLSSLTLDSALWEYEKSDTVTVDATGNTVLNIYFKRKTFTLTFNYNYSSGRYNKQETITARWGANILEKYNAIAANAGGVSWSSYYDGGDPYTIYFGVMPKASAQYYLRYADNQKCVMTYYAEDFNGNYKEMFKTTEFGYGKSLVVSEEDRFEFEGFTFDHGTDIDEPCDGAEFYYKRNTYKLNFYSESKGKFEKSSNVKYQEALSGYYYVPTSKPSTVESDAVFAGWYLNPEFTGEQFDFTSHRMPSNNLALYAKWINGYYSVETYTDDSLSTLYTYEGYNGIQNELEKYDYAQAPTSPQSQTGTFIGWYYKDADQTEHRFSFTLPITKNYKLYPKFTNETVLNYTVHYYLEGTTDKVASDKQDVCVINQYVTEKAKTGSMLDLVENTDNYFPIKISTSVAITEEGQEITFYYKKGITADYTVKYVDGKGNTLKTDASKTTSYAVITEDYAEIYGYIPREKQIVLELSTDATQNVITFVYDLEYTELTIKKEGSSDVDKDQTFIFEIKGIDTLNSEISLTVTVHGNSEVTVTGLTLGKYSITEKTDWSWRYQPQAETQEKTLVSNATQNTVTFVNTRTKDKWLNGDSYKVNLFNANNEENVNEEADIR